MYTLKIYNGVFELSVRGTYDIFDEAIDELIKAELEYMDQLDYNYESEEYNQELENFRFNSRIDG